MAKKSWVKEYWEITKLPIIILIGWSLLGTILAIAAFDTYMGLFAKSGWILTLIVWAFAGYLATSEHKKSIWQGAKAGAFAAAVAAIVGVVFGLIMFTLQPAMIEQAIQQAVAQGAPRGQVESMIRVMTYVGLFLGPVFSAVGGLGLGALGGLIGKKI